MVEAAENGASRRDKRRRAILDAAAHQFLRRGYGATSLAEIVRYSGGSLATLYDIFGSKAGLFRAMIEERCAEVTELVASADLSGRPAKAALTEIARRILDLALEDDMVIVMRLIVAEGQRFPELGVQFLESGPMALQAKLTHYLEGQAGRGGISFDDPADAAAMFQQMVSGDLHWRSLCGVPVDLTAEARNRHVEHVVGIFLRAFAHDPDEARPAG